MLRRPSYTESSNNIDTQIMMKSGKSAGGIVGLEISLANGSALNHGRSKFADAKVNDISTVSKIMEKMAKLIENRLNIAHANVLLTWCDWRYQ